MVHVEYRDPDRAVCDECLQFIPFEISTRDENIYLQKVCPLHGRQETLLSTDANYYLRGRSLPLARTPFVADTKIVRGCPYDCGLCEDHEQAPTMVIVEVLDECNLLCPTCIAASGPGGGKVRSYEDIIGRVSALSNRQGPLSLVMVSGGEPALHPDIIQILKGIKKYAKCVMLITNGVRISQDSRFVEGLASIGNGLEIYLQFDSFREEVLRELRGDDFREVRSHALASLEKAGIPVTLVCVVKKGLNGDEVGTIVKGATNYQNVRGVTFQPIRASGRHLEFDKSLHSITLSEVRRQLITDLGLSDDALVPHPRNPENICIGYFLKGENGRDLIEVTTKVFEKDRPERGCIDELMYFLPEVNSLNLTYDKLFRITVVSFLDKHNFTLNQVRRSGIVFLTDDGLLVPLDVYYLFGAKGQQKTSAAIPIRFFPKT